MFKKYSSIENTYRNTFLEHIKSYGFWDEEFVIQEKVHGANLSFWTKDGENFFSAKRTSMIEPQEDFYNYASVLKEIKPQLSILWNLVKTDFPSIHQLTIFGELFGGDYPHPEVELDKHSKMVQSGIFYSPKNHFYAFDIVLDANEYLDVDTCNKYFEAIDILHAKTIFRGNIEACLQYENDFNTHIPAMLGLPLLEPNMVEGVVIKPVKPLFFNNGIRVIMKNKNDKWSENTKYHKSISRVEAPSEQVVKLKEAILTYVTENRLNNVVSKIGEITQSDFGKVIGMFSKDVVDDFTKDYQELLDDLRKKEVKMINKSIGNAVVKLVKKNIIF